MAIVINTTVLPTGVSLGDTPRIGYDNIVTASIANKTKKNPKRLSGS